MYKKNYKKKLLKLLISINNQKKKIKPDNMLSVPPINLNTQREINFKGEKMKLLISLLIITALTACSTMGSTKKQNTLSLGKDKPKELIGKVQLKTLPSFLLAGYNVNTKQSETSQKIPAIWQKLMGNFVLLSQAKTKGEYWGLYYNYTYSKKTKEHWMHSLQ